MWRSEQEMRRVVGERAAGIRRRRRGAAVAGLAAVLVAAAVGGVAAVGHSGDGGHQQVQVGSSPDGSLRALPPSPLSARAEAASTWTGSHFLIWGGQTTSRHFNDGAGYDPSTRTWMRLPRSPLSARGRPVSVWTGSQWILWGGYGGPLNWLPDGATYTPATRRWQEMPAPPAALLGGVPAGRDHPPSYATKLDGSGAWLGSKLLVVDDLPGGGSSPDVFAGSYDPTTGHWAVLPDPPCYPAFTEEGLVWTGHLAVLLCQTQISSGGGVGYGDDGLFLAAYNPSTNHWSEASPPHAIDARPDLAWDGHDVLLVGVAGWDPRTGAWTSLAGSSFAQGETSPAAWTGRVVLVVGPTKESGAYDPATNTWAGVTALVSARAAPMVVWTGTTLFSWGGYDPSSGRYFADGSAYRPHQ